MPEQTFQRRLRQKFANYLRIYLPGLLADRYRRILYLDADMYVHSRKIFDCLGLDMGGKCIAGVRDPWTCFMDREDNIRELETTLGSRHRKYLNSGFLLIDVARYRTEQVEARLVEIISTMPDKLQIFDQSALNILLDGDWQELTPAFNSTLPYWSTFCRAVSEPVVVHFEGRTKPWHGPRFSADHPARRDLERFLKGSPWSGFLAKFYSFGDAWSNVAAGGTALSPGQAQLALTAEEARRFANYLRTTAFADVEQGITELRLDRIPAGL